ncbi:MAG: hypothetical protein ACK4VI_06595 [Alphaproteobacteria bacterium]
MPEASANTRKLSAIEIEMESKLPINGAFASGGMVSIVQTLNLSEEYKPDFSFWNSEHICRCDDKHIVQAYLTEERAKVLTEVLKRKNTWGIFIFRGDDTLLRIDTPEPFDNIEKLTKVIDTLIAAAKILELKSKENLELTAIQNKKKAAPVVEIKDEDLGVIDIELEEDES